jgi:hypothetical protein
LLNYRFAGTFPVQPRPTVRRARTIRASSSMKGDSGQIGKTRFDGGLSIRADDFGPNVAVSIRMSQ